MIREGFFRVGGRRLEFRSWATPDASTTILLLHEGLGCVGLWLDFPERLAAASGCNVLAFSRGGYGQSDAIDLPRPLDYMTREAQEVLPHVVDATGVDRVILVGHSDGATIAAIHAGSVRDARVKGVVLIAPHFFTEPMGLASISAAKQAYEQGDLRQKLARWHRHVDCAFRGWSDAWLDPGFICWNVESFLAGIEAPVALIQGDADAYGTLAQVRAVERGVRGRVETHALPGIGHSPHREACEETITIVAGFVQQSSLRGA
jgi:pimeloyl-ACP methyl ester carboxylesterase